MNGSAGICSLYTQKINSLISEQKNIHMMFTEKGATRKGNVSIATKLSHFLFLYTLIVFL